MSLRPASIPTVNLQLPSGLFLRDAIWRMKLKFREWPWKEYDEVEVVNPDVITDEDVDLAFRMGARAPINRVRFKKSVQEVKTKLSDCLRAIPTKPALEDVDLETLRIPIVDLFRCLTEIPGMKLANATKIIHRHRRRLLPIIDSVVENYYWFATSIGESKEKQFFRLNNIQETGAYAFEVLKLIREDLTPAVCRDIDILRDSVKCYPCANASRVRILESLIWHYYARAWRDEPSDSESD